MSKRATSPRLSGDDRRAVIMLAARAIFASRGYHGTSTAEIAAAAGCSEATLYKHFPSKQSLFAQALGESMDSLSRVIDSLVDERDDPTLTLADVTRRLFTTREFAENVRLRSLALALVEEEPQVRKVVDRATRMLRDKVAGIVELAQQRGHVRQDIDPRSFAWMWVGLSLVSGLRRTLEGDGVLERLPALSDALVQMLHEPGTGLPAQPPGAPEQ